MTIGWNTRRISSRHVAARFPPVPPIPFDDQTIIDTDGPS